MAITQDEELIFKPLTPSIGAEVQGVDLTVEIDDVQFQRILDAWISWGVLIFRDQALDLEQHVALGRRFGELYSHILPDAKTPPGYPEVIELHTDAHSERAGGESWHTDVSADEEPPMASILHITETPDTGGDTLFASMNAVYDDLSGPMKSFLSGLTATHRASRGYNAVHDRNQPQGPSTVPLGGWEFPDSHHPVIRTHPVTGRHSVYVNTIYTSHIDELAPDESDSILAVLLERIHNPRYQCRVQWRKNTVVLWDNRCVQHHAVWDYFPKLRHGNRVTIKGDRPFFSPPA
jgi:taurine dioxygenase